MALCQFCRQSFSSTTNVQRHQNQALACRKKLDLKFGNLLKSRRSAKKALLLQPQAPTHQHLSHLPGDTAFLTDFDSSLDLPEVDDGLTDSDQDAIPPQRMVEVEDIEAPGRERWRRTFPQAGSSTGRGSTSFQTIRDDQILKGSEIFGPFKDEEEWGLAKWLIKNAGQNQAESLLKLPIVCRLSDVGG